MGNPHYHLGPKAFLQGGETILNTFIEVDPKNAETYLKNFDKVTRQINSFADNIRKKLSSARDKKFIEYHREFTYFFKEFNLHTVGAIEKVPGVPPSAGRLARVSIQSKKIKVSLALASISSPKKLTDKYQAMSKVPVARLPISIIEGKGPKNYFQLLNLITNIILKKAK